MKSSHRAYPCGRFQPPPSPGAYPTMSPMYWAPGKADSHLCHGRVI